MFAGKWRKQHAQFPRRVRPSPHVTAGRSWPSSPPPDPAPFRVQTGQRVADSTSRDAGQPFRAKRRGGATLRRPRARAVRAHRRPRRSRVRPREPLPALRRARNRQDAAREGGRRSRGTPGGAGALGPRVGRRRDSRPTGRGCRCSGRTCGARIPRSWRRSSTAARSTSANWCPSCRARLSASPDGSAAARLDSDNARFYLFDSVTEFLRNGAARRPLVIVLDDVHAADLPSLLLLRFLAAELHEMRILAIGTYRAGEARRAPEVGSVLADLARGRRIALGGLAERDIAALDRRVPPGSRLPRSSSRRSIA